LSRNSRTDSRGRVTGLGERGEDRSELRQLRDCTIEIREEFQGRRGEGTGSSPTVLNKRRIYIIYSQNINCTMEEGGRTRGRRREGFNRRDPVLNRRNEDDS
jgi:hypothetical protein